MKTGADTDTIMVIECTPGFHGMVVARSLKCVAGSRFYISDDHYALYQRFKNPTEIPILPVTWNLNMSIQWTLTEPHEK
jgi:hypothetical protein